MIPVLPALTVRPFEAEDGETLLALINDQLRRASYSDKFEPAVWNEHLQHPQSRFTARWQQVRPLCAWRAGELVGFLEATTGFNSQNLTLPDYQPMGFLRFIALTERADIQNEILFVLLRAAEQFWLEQKAYRISAFTNDMGYPQFQGGMGALPGDWDAIVRALTSHGFAFSQRYYLLQRTLRFLLEEDVPMADLRLEYQRNRDELRYNIYYRLVEHVASARVVDITQMAAATRTLHLLELFVNETWRNHNIGKWLLRRIINDATMATFSEIIAFPASNQSVALALLGQQGFVEQNYRGYTLQKELTP